MKGTEEMTKTGRPKGRIGSGGVWLFLLIFAWGAPAVFAQEAYFNDIIITNNTDDLLLYAQLEGVFTREMDEALFNGIPLSITFNIRLMGERGLWMDEEISTLRIQHLLVYDLTTGLCQFTEEEPLKKNSRATRNLPTAIKWMKELGGVKVSNFRALLSGRRYYIMIKADIRQGTVAFPLNYFSWLFRTGANVSTPWQRASFVK